jgi:glutamate dehydrogenase
VLRDNYEQNVLLGNARSQAASLLPVHQRLIRELEATGGLDRELEVLPTEEELARLAAAGEGLSSPELSVLVAYVKNSLARRFVDSALPDDPWFAQLLSGYFPTAVRSRFADRLAGHPLRRQIITTALVNDLVNRGGISFAYRAAEEVGASYEAVARAYTVVREVFDLPTFWAEVEQLDNQVPTAAQSALLLESRRLLDRAVRWFIQHRRDLSDITGQVQRYRPVVQALLQQVPSLLRGEERDRLERRADEFIGKGAPEGLAERTAALLDGFSLLDVAEIAAAVDDEPADIAALYFVLSEHFAVDAMLLRITALPRDDRWEAMARMSLRYDLYATQAALTRQVAQSTDPGLSADDRVAAWEQANAEAVDRLRTTMHEITGGEVEGLAPLSVGLRVLRSLVDGVA